MLAAFHLHRDNLAFQGDHEVNLLGALVIPPEIAVAFFDAAEKAF